MMKAKNARLIIQLNSFGSPSCININIDLVRCSFNDFYLYIFVLEIDREEECGSSWACHTLAQCTFPITTPGLTSEFG